MSDTPRTDAKAHQGRIGLLGGWTTVREWVEAEDMRKLERELSALQHDNARLAERAEQLERALKLKELVVEALKCETLVIENADLRAKLEQERHGHAEAIEQWSIAEGKVKALSTEAEKDDKEIECLHQRVEQLESENRSFRAEQKACEDCAPDAIATARRDGMLEAATVSERYGSSYIAGKIRAAAVQNAAPQGDSRQPVEVADRRPAASPAVAAPSDAPERIYLQHDPEDTGEPFAEAHGWISVKDRLPTHIHSVLVYVTDGPEPYRDIGIYNNARGQWQVNDGDDNINVEVSHWMPLPAAPDIQNSPKEKT